MIRQAVRRLVRAPALTTAATLTLVLAMGGATTVFTLVDGVLLRPLPYERADRLVDLSHTLEVGAEIHVDQSDATYLLYRQANHAFTDMGAYRTAAVNLGAGTGARAGGVTPERVAATYASASVFSALRARPMLGRMLTADDERPGAAPVVVIGQRLWERRFASDDGIITAGRRMMIDGVAHQVVGVMPARFQFPAYESALWLPLQLDASNTKSAAFDYRGIARLRDGASIAAATAELDRLLPTVPVVFPGRLTVPAIQATHMRSVVRPLRDVTVGNVGRVLWIVLGAVGLLLLVACANVANLFLARADARRRELAVRSALGARRLALFSELASEALLVVAAGTILGIACAVAGVRVLESISLAQGIPRLHELSVDGRVVAVAAAMAVLAVVVISAMPLLRLGQSSLSAALLASSRSATEGRARHRVRHALVVAQVALALILVAGAGVFARSFAKLRAVDPGFAADGALTFRLALPEAAYATTGDAARVVLRALGAIAATPGVDAAGVITKLPLDAESRQDSAVFVEDHPIAMGGMPDLYSIDFATPGYFRAMGIPILAGRTFRDPDPSGAPADGPPEVIVSAAFAEHYWGVANAVGKRVRMTPGDPWHVIVGVAGSVRGAGLEEPPSAEVYAPLVTMSAAGAPWMPRNVAFVVHTTGDPAAIAAPVRRALSTVDRALPMYRVMPASDLVAAATARTTFTLLLLAIAAVVAMTIGALGIYGVISYLVGLRAREIGVRIALGADAKRVRAFVTRQAMIDALIGVIAGVAGAVALARVVGSVAIGVSPSDPATLTAASILLLGTALAASWVPAMRAAALDPASALRME